MSLDAARHVVLYFKTLEAVNLSKKKKHDFCLFLLILHNIEITMIINNWNNYYYNNNKVHNSSHCGENEKLRYSLVSREISAFNFWETVLKTKENMNMMPHGAMVPQHIFHSRCVLSTMSHNQGGRMDAADLLIGLRVRELSLTCSFSFDVN